MIVNIGPPAFRNCGNWGHPFRNYNKESTMGHHNSSNFYGQIPWFLCDIAQILSHFQIHTLDREQFTFHRSFSLQLSGAWGCAISNKKGRAVLELSVCVFFFFFENVVQTPNLHRLFCQHFACRFRVSRLLYGKCSKIHLQLDLH